MKPSSRDARREPLQHSTAFGPCSASSACSFIWSTTTPRGSALSQILDVAMLGRAVDDHVEMVAAAGRHQIVDDPAVVVEQQRIAQLHVRRAIARSPGSSVSSAASASGAGDHAAGPCG